jgi:hypothetical protein
MAEWAAEVVVLLVPVVPLLDFARSLPPLEETLDCRRYFPPQENPDYATRRRQNLNLLDFADS